MSRKILFILAIVLIVLFGFVIKDFIKSSIGKAAMSARSTVTIKEAPITEEPEEGGITPKANFIVSPSLIKVLLKQGESKTESLEIINIGDIALWISLELENIEGFVSVSEESFKLKPGNVKRIDLVTHPHNSKIIGLYLSYGFIIEAWKDNHFGDGEPRIVLARELQK